MFIRSLLLLCHLSTALLAQSHSVPQQYDNEVITKNDLGKIVPMISIRKAQEADIASLEELFLNGRQNTFTWENPDKFKREDYRKATEGEIVFVAEEAGEIVGFISVWEQDAYPFIHHLFVLPDYHRKGVGSLLIRSLFATLPRPYRLKCVLKNQDALAFYLKNNWLEIERGVGEDGEYVLLELPLYPPFSEVALVSAQMEDKAIVQNLGQFYIYKMSRYCGYLPSWKTPQDGLFKCADLSAYFEKPDRHPFLIKVDGELAGFVLVDKRGSTPDVDWNIGEFFITSKFQGKGIGRTVAQQVFDRFPGTWETSQIPENTAAIEFWHQVVNQYTNGQFESTLKMLPKPKPHPMIILKFTSSGRL